MKVTPWITDELDNVVALAAARIQINSVTPIGEEVMIDALNPKYKERVVTVAVSYEFQWKHRGSYTWERMVDFYHIILDAPAKVHSDYMPDYDDNPPTGATFWYAQKQIYKDVIRAREQLEDPNDRGEYTYYLDAEE